MYIHIEENMNFYNKARSFAKSLFQPRSPPRIVPTDQQIRDAAARSQEQTSEGVVAEIQGQYFVSPEKIRSVLGQATPAKRKVDEIEISEDYQACRKSKTIRTLCSKEINVEESFEKISQALQNGPNEQVASGKRQLVVVGVTGSGKSTLVNSLVGCRLEKLSAADADRLQVSRQALRVVSVSEGGPRDEVSAIGNQHGKSCTSNFQAVDLADVGLCIWDIPGFKDTQGAEINIANAVNLSKLLKISQDYGLIICVVLDLPSLESRRGQVITDTVEILKSLFDSENGEIKIQENIFGILFCVTKATGDCVSLETVRNWIIRGADSAGLNLNAVRDQIVMYDPLQRNAEAVSREILLSIMLKMSPISSAKQILFKPSIGAEELLLIQRIAATTRERILSSLSTTEFQVPRIQKAVQHLELFGSFSEIDESIILNTEDSITTILESINGIVQEWAETVRSNKDKFDGDGRRLVGFYLEECLKQAKALEPFLSKICSVQNLYNQTLSIAKEAERAGQASQLQNIRGCFERTLCCFQQDLLNHFSGSRAPCPLTGPVNYCTIESKSCLNILQDFPLVGSTGLKEVICAVEAMEKDLDCPELFLWGDQVNFCAFANDKRREVVNGVKRILLETGIKQFAEAIVLNSTSIVAEQSYGVQNPRTPRLLSEKALIVEERPSLESYGFEPGLQALLELLLQAVIEFPDKSIQKSFSSSVNATFEQIYHMAVIKFRETEDLYREERRKIIERILAAGKFEKEMFELKDALSGLKAMNGGKDLLYKNVIKNVKLRLDSIHSVSEIATLIKAGSYHVLVSRYECLQQLKDLLKDYLTINTKTIETAVQKEVRSLIDNAIAEIRMDVNSPDYLQFHELRSFIGVFSKLEKVFPKIKESRQTLQEEAKTNLERMIVNLISGLGDDVLRSEGPRNIARLLVKSYGVATELNLVDHFRSVIQRDLLNGFDDHHRYLVGHSLKELCSSSSEGVEEMARTIIDTFREFKTFNIEIFNKKAGGASFADALKSLSCHSGASVSPSESNFLEAAYDQFIAVYSVQVNNLISDIRSFPKESVKSRIDSIAAYMDAKHLSRTHREFGEFLALIAAIWTYLAAKEGTQHGLEKKFVKQPHATQILGIFRLLGLDEDGLGNHLIQINTGEGKSVALGFTAVVLAKLGYRVDVVCYNRYLSQRDFREFSDLFSALGVTSMIDQRLILKALRVLKSSSMFGKIEPEFAALSISVLSSKPFLQLRP